MELQCERKNCANSSPVLTTYDSWIADGWAHFIPSAASVRLMSIAWKAGIMAGSDDMATVKAPAWKFEWNLNTLVILMGFAAGFVAWGATWRDVQVTSLSNSQAIERMDKRLTAVEVGIRSLDTQELRLSAVEKQASDAAASMRSLEVSLNSLTTDVKVVKEILIRLESAQSSPRR